jgi:predicted small lipoprotein YifL
MNRRKTVRPLTTFLTLLLLATALAGCGKKGPVRPLRQPQPGAAEEFTLRQQGDRMLLVWSLPQQNEDGTPLTDLAGFRIYRGTFEPGDDCPECLQTPKLWRLVDLEYLRDVQRVGDRFFAADSDLQPGQGYQYRIIPFNRWGQDGKPALQRQVLSEPPPAPSQVAAAGQNGTLLVTWQPPSSLPEGMELLGYNVYRRRPDRAFPPAPHNPQPVAATRLEDRDFAAGKTYLYAVRAVVRQDGRVLESRLSDVAPGFSYSDD